MKIQLDPLAFMPVKAHREDAGFDLKTPIDFTVPAGGSYTVDTGVHIQIPSYYVGFLKAKSGLNVNHGIIGEGVIDAGYTGSIRVKLYNLSDTSYAFKRSDKVIQLVLLPVIATKLTVVDKLDDSDRGDNGFGSSGR